MRNILMQTALALGICSCGGELEQVDLSTPSIEQNICTYSIGAGYEIGTYYSAPSETDSGLDPMVAGCTTPPGGPQYNDALYAKPPSNAIKEYWSALIGDQEWMVGYSIVTCSCGRESFYVAACGAYAYRCKST